MSGVFPGKHTPKKGLNFLVYVIDWEYSIPVTDARIVADAF